MISKNKIKKKVYFLSGKRGGYDALLPLMKELSKLKYIDSKIILTDQHLLSTFGQTSRLVSKEFKKKNIIKIQINQKNSSNKERLNSMAILIKKLTTFLLKDKPNLLIVYGDRAESVIAGFVCINLDVPLCHFQGGDLSGNIDEKFRHILTKMSDLHFPSNQISRRRILQLGESPKYVLNIGDSHIDALKKVKFNKQKILKKYLMKKDEKYCVLLFHPDGTSLKKNKMYIKTIINSLKQFDLKVICVYPCTDIGYESIIDILNKLKNKNKFKVYPNIIYSDFINLLKYSKFFIGNSSSGIIESPYLKVPFINLGDRQKNRLKSQNVIESNIEFKNILRSIKVALSKKFQQNMKNLELYYGKGDSYKIAIKNILKNLDKIDLNKKFNEIK